jgi:hypothetical protein
MCAIACGGGGPIRRSRASRGELARKNLDPRSIDASFRASVFVRARDDDELAACPLAELEGVTAVLEVSPLRVEPMDDVDTRGRVRRSDARHAERPLRRIELLDQCFEPAQN